MNDIGNSVSWLFGGNYEAEQVQQFSEIIVKFAMLGELEQSHILDILKEIADNEFFNNEEEVIDWLIKILKREEGENLPSSSKNHQE